MSAAIIDGKAFSARVQQAVAEQIATLKERHDITPKLVVLIVGDDPASHVYVRNKGLAAKAAGMAGDTEILAADTTQAELLRRVHELNADASVHGILVQLPLPKHIDDAAVINAIDPDKDVDGFHVINAGRLATGQECLVPCTPQGCLLMLRDWFDHPIDRHSDRGAADEESAAGLVGAADLSPAVRDDGSRGSRGLSGLHAVVIGKSNIVGRPMAMLLLQEGCTVTVTHSKTLDVAAETRRADIVIVAVGRPEMVKGDWLKPGAVVIDVGINRIERDGKPKLVGDVEFASAAEIAGAITPVPGGVGPMTIACLLRNTVCAACLQHSIEFASL